MLLIEWNCVTLTRLNYTNRRLSPFETWRWLDLNRGRLESTGFRRVIASDNHLMHSTWLISRTDFRKPSTSPIEYQPCFDHTLREEWTCLATHSLPKTSFISSVKTCFDQWINDHMYVDKQSVSSPSCVWRHGTSHSSPSPTSSAPHQRCRCCTPGGRRTATYRH